MLSGAGGMHVPDDLNVLVHHSNLANSPPSTGFASAPAMIKCPDSSNFLAPPMWPAERGWRDVSRKHKSLQLSFGRRDGGILKHRRYAIKPGRWLNLLKQFF